MFVTDSSLCLLYRSPPPPPTNIILLLFSQPHYCARLIALLCSRAALGKACSACSHSYLINRFPLCRRWRRRRRRRARSYPVRFLNDSPRRCRRNLHRGCCTGHVYCLDYERSACVIGGNTCAMRTTRMPYCLSRRPPIFSTVAR